MPESRIGLKRIYEPPDPSDGRRVLVDRLWPRGMTKAEAAVDEWAKDLAPSADLRRRYHGRPEDWEAFRALYRAELAGREGELDRLAALAREGPVTLLFASKNEARNNATVLKAVLEERLRGGGPAGA